MAGVTYSKFFWADHRSDPCVRMCGAGARGLWIEMLALMAEAIPQGHLLVNGKPPTDAQLAVLTAIPPDQIASFLTELDSAGVFSRTAKGVIYSRRMTRDAKKARLAREHGKKGGNPTLGKDERKSTWDNPPLKPPDKGGVTPTNHLPLATSQESNNEDSGYAFAGAVIRLRGRDFEKWRSAYHAIPDLHAELQSLDDYLATQGDRKNWFLAASNMLKKKHEKRLAEPKPLAPGCVAIDPEAIERGRAKIASGQRNKLDEGSDADRVVPMKARA